MPSSSKSRALYADAYKESTGPGEEGACQWRTAALLEVDRARSHAAPNVNHVSSESSSSAAAAVVQQHDHPASETDIRRGLLPDSEVDVLHSTYYCQQRWQRRVTDPYPLNRRLPPARASGRPAGLWRLAIVRPRSIAVRVSLLVRGGPIGTDDWRCPAAAPRRAAAGRMQLNAELALEIGLYPTSSSTAASRWCHRRRHAVLNLVGISATVRLLLLLLLLLLRADECGVGGVMRPGCVDYCFNRAS